jgi:MoaA/NifB/PqqE/SkfB family radical SAM enzyme
VLKSLEMEITTQCNERCIHCYCPENIEKKHLEDLELFDRMLAEFAEMEFIYLTLTGGEPLLNPKFREIFKIGRKHRYSITVKTNGTLIDEDFASFFGEMRPEEVTVSIYSSDSSEHDSITGIPGSFERSMNGLNLLKKYGVKCSALTPVMKGVKKWKELYAMMKTLGIHWSCSANIVSAFDNRENVEILKNTYEEYSDFFNFVNQYEDQKREIVLSERYAGCMAGIKKVAVDPSFFVRPCLDFYERAGKYTGGNAKELFNRSRQMFEEILALTPCLSCSAAKICVPCPAHIRIVAGKGFCDESRKQHAKAYCDFFNLTGNGL